MIIGEREGFRAFATLGGPDRKPPFFALPYPLLETAVVGFRKKSELERVRACDTTSVVSYGTLFGTLTKLRKKR